MGLLSRFVFWFWCVWNVNECAWLAEGLIVVIELGCSDCRGMAEWENGGKLHGSLSKSAEIVDNGVGPAGPDACSSFW